MVETNNLRVKTLSKEIRSLREEIRLKLCEIDYIQNSCRHEEQESINGTGSDVYCKECGKMTHSSD